MTLDIIWYFVIVLSVICYAMLDGFDLGVGLLHPFAKTDHERRIFLNAIGPVWDGNEVWLVIVGGALFAGFPEVYATVFSAFYIPTMILLMGLIFRAVSIEFRSKSESKRWRSIWDGMFAFGSFVIAFGLGVVLGNLIEGIPLDKSFNYVGSFALFLRPYSLLMGLTTVSLFMMHGVNFLVMKTEGALHARLRSWAPKAIAFFIIAYVALTIATAFVHPQMMARMREHPAFFLIPVIAFLTIICTPLLMNRKLDGWAFLSSCLSIALLLSLYSVGTFPYMVRSTIDPEKNSLLIANSAASTLTLQILLIIVAIGIPMVLGYGFYVYRVFRGKVKLEVSSY
jgi:cytochrome d ubiquinol oxidase subunit II